MRRLLGIVVLLVSCGGSGPEMMMADAGTKPDTGVGCAVTKSFDSLYTDMLSQPRCAVSSCHEGGGAAGGMDFTSDADTVHDFLVDGDTHTDEAKAAYPKRVVAGEPSQSFFYIKVTEEEPGGNYKRMPPGAVPLPDCEMKAIEDWITEGAPR